MSIKDFFKSRSSRRKKPAAEKPGEMTPGQEEKIRQEIEKMTVEELAADLFGEEFLKELDANAEKDKSE